MPYYAQSYLYNTEYIQYIQHSDCNVRINNTLHSTEYGSTVTLVYYVPRYCTVEVPACDTPHAGQCNIFRGRIVDGAQLSIIQAFLMCLDIWSMMILSFPYDLIMYTYVVESLSKCLSFLDSPQPHENCVAFKKKLDPQDKPRVTSVIKWSLY